MKIAIPRETGPLERRVAATPETVRRLVGLGASPVVESGAGIGAGIADEDYREAGASVETDAASVMAEARIVLAVQPPDPGILPQGAVLIGLLNPHGAETGAAAAAWAARGVDAFALELTPRITRAQSMDVLSSQSNLAGYRAVIDAVAAFGRAIPMMMTAAGRINPARVLVMGAGVAGLQAIATARRLGAVVSATDVRPAAREQVESLGASFVMVESDETASAETAGGYAREMSGDYRQKQAALVAETIRSQDIVITTALIPGRPAPMLVSAAMVASMRPGSVIVDLAAEQGGNCELSRPGKTTTRHGVTILAPLNMASRLATDASALYARNVLNFLTPMIDRDSGNLKIDPDDDILRDTAITRAGEIVNEMVNEMVNEAVRAGAAAGPVGQPGPAAKRKPTASTTASRSARKARSPGGKATGGPARKATPQDKPETRGA